MDRQFNIAYSDIIDRCTKLSAFEAKEAVASDGSSNFTAVRITEKDHTAIIAYIEEGAHIVEARLSNIFSLNSEYGETGAVWTIMDDTRRRNAGAAGGFVKSTKEALAAFTLSRWLEEKKPETAKIYANMFKDLADAAVRIIATKTKPQRP